MLKAVNFVGRVDHAGCCGCCINADAAVLPSHYEPFGIVALEAAAAGRAAGDLERGRAGRGGHRRRDRPVLPAP